MLGFKSFESAQITLSGIEMVRMIKKNQLINPEITPFKSFCHGKLIYIFGYKIVPKFPDATEPIS